MEIIKNNESFSLKDNNGTYEMSGSLSRDVSGSLNIHFNVNTLDGERVGDGHYNKYGENGEVNFGINCVEDKRDALTAYADTVVDSVLAYVSNL